MAELEFTMNETVALMHKDRAETMKGIIEHIEKYIGCYDVQEILNFLREIEDNADAQRMVVELRDTL